MNDYNIPYAFKVNTDNLKNVIDELRHGDSMGGFKVLNIVYDENEKLYFITCLRKHSYPYVTGRIDEMCEK